MLCGLASVLFASFRVQLKKRGGGNGIEFGRAFAGIPWAGW